mmetsp:Transcript_129977/g.362147  ORF Transcript_129977/g.362147 Transcript_129977/m.362147 type:complete len:399 (+) Transcript_129977:1-1197(+)
MPAYALFGFGGPGIHLANFHASNLFPEMKRTVTASFSGVFGTSGLVFTIFRALYVAGMSTSAICGLYAGLVACIALQYLGLQPSRSYVPGDGLVLSGCCPAVVRAVATGAQTSRGGTAAGPQHHLGVLEAMTDWRMLGLGVFFSFSFLHLKFFLGIEAQILNRLGDDRLGSPYLLAFNIIGSSALAVFYPVGQLLDRMTWDMVFLTSLLLMVAVDCISLVDNLPFQVVAFFCWVFSRIVLFAGFFSFIPVIVGFQRFGLIAGWLSLLSAFVGLLNIPLARAALQATSHHGVIAGLLVMQLVLVAFPLALRRERLRRQEEAEAARKDAREQAELQLPAPPTKPRSTEPPSLGDAATLEEGPAMYDVRVAIERPRGNAVGGEGAGGGRAQVVCSCLGGFW